MRTQIECPPQLKQVEVKQITKAHGAWCETCQMALGCQYWTLNKSVAMHKRGTGHTITLWKFQ